MRVCLPTQDDTGLGARLSQHFGSAPYFTFVETDSGALEVVPNAHAVHDHGSCSAAGDLRGHTVDALVCRGLGRRAFAGLAEAGIEVFVTDEPDVGAAVSGFKAGQLEHLRAEAACGGGRGHEHGHGHGHGHGC